MGNDRETTTKVATTVKRRLLHLAIIEAPMITLTTTAKLQQLRVNSREMTTFAASCNDREMQRPRSDKLETAQLLQNLRKILCRFMAVVVSSAFWKSLSGLLRRVKPREDGPLEAIFQIGDRPKMVSEGGTCGKLEFLRDLKRKMERRGGGNILS